MGADIACCQQQVATSGEHPRQTHAGRSSNGPDLATKQPSQTRCAGWWSAGRERGHASISLVGTTFQAADSRYVSQCPSRRYKSPPAALVGDGEWQQRLSAEPFRCLFQTCANGWWARYASYTTPSACSSKPGLPQIRFDVVRWRWVETRQATPFETAG
ncbi:uncharacterized protein LY89DRAFT_422939 [Mollisia scopiformis]|uniref:Uncharacterized protein n=1 Tax=Mollisia scopiformis TaxID=149040 RepID=A0A194XLQ4_MOLSC|nr:uncharacterized protein LY89DRAFT_422939 [Mollisia scopiformis]KUJ21014.1 hypothetical protein LY89DRAFT_422939 [Mollisia scopiformis]